MRSQSWSRPPRSTAAREATSASKAVRWQASSASKSSTSRANARHAWRPARPARRVRGGAAPAVQHDVDAHAQHEQPQAEALLRPHEEAVGEAGEPGGGAQRPSAEAGGGRRRQGADGPYHPRVDAHRPQPREPVRPGVLQDREGHLQHGEGVGQPVDLAGAARGLEGLAGERRVERHPLAHRFDRLPLRGVEDEVPALQGEGPVVAAEAVAQERAAGTGQDELGRHGALPAARSGAISRGRHADQAQNTRSAR